MLLKTPKNREFVPTLFVKTTDFQLVFNFEQTRTVTIFGENGIMTHILIMAKPIRALELRYPMIQLLITSVMCPYRPPLFPGYSFRPHVSGELGIRVRNFLNPLSRVEIFE